MLGENIEVAAIEFPIGEVWLGNEKVVAGTERYKPFRVVELVSCPERVDEKRELVPSTTS
jgi:hypothetical protein